MKHINPREIRNSLGLNQQQFWTRIGVTQSGGSRYENGRNIPKPVQALINAVYVHQIDLEKIDSRTAPIIRAVLAGEVDATALVQAIAGSSDAPGLSATSAVITGLMNTKTIPSHAGSTSA